MKFKSFLLAHKALIKDVAISTCLIGATAGVIFGVSAGTFKINYLKLDGAEAKYQAYLKNNYLSEDIKSQWNMNGGFDPTSKKTIEPIQAPKTQWITSDDPWWQDVHFGAKHYDDPSLTSGMELDTEFGKDIGNDAKKMRYAYTSMIIDGAAHSTMDRSFNESLYGGLVDFNQNKICDHYDPETETDPTTKNIAHSYKPSQDNTTEFINIYLSAIRNHTVVSLAGFNHTTPLGNMMVHQPNDKGTLDGRASCTDSEANMYANQSAFILLDANQPNNQCVASVQFRSDQPAFLTGVATCQYFIENLDIYHDQYQTLAVGSFGGVKIPSVTIYLGGFQKGIEFFNYFVLPQIAGIGAQNYLDEESDHPDHVEAFKKLLEHSKYRDEINKLKDYQEYETKGFLKKLIDEYEVKMIDLGGIDTHFSGTFAAGDAIGITKQLLNRGAGAIIAVAGPQSLDVAQEIKNQGSKCIVIGVDTAMEDSDYQRYHDGCDEKSKLDYNTNDPYRDRMVADDNSHSQQANSVIKFSAIKDIHSVTREITRLCAGKKYNGGLEEKTNTFNWDITRNEWDHNFVFPTKLENQLVVNEENWSCQKSQDGTYIEIGEPKIKGKIDEKITTLIVPEQLKLQGETNLLPVKVLKTGFVGNLLTENKNIRFVQIFSRQIRFMKNSFENLGNVCCIDLANIKQATDIYGSEAGAFGAWDDTVENGGAISVKNAVDREAKSVIATTLKQLGLKKDDKNWFYFGPDPNRAICSCGYQTCANIQNGLVSISWDGFYPLIKALNLVIYTDGISPGAPLSFSDAWVKACESYFQDCYEQEIILDERYKEGVQDINNLKTFRRTDDNGQETIYYQNYKHTIGILGKLLSGIALIDVPKECSLVPIDDNDFSKGFQMMEGGDRLMSIIDWLHYNMYLIG